MSRRKLRKNKSGDPLFLLQNWLVCTESKPQAEFKKNSPEQTFCHSNVTIFSNGTKSAPENFCKISSIIPLR